MMAPRAFRVVSMVKETCDVFTVGLAQLDGERVFFLPGQFNMLYHFGFGEVPMSICGGGDVFFHTIRAVGPVTCAMRNWKVGDVVGVRGPFGTSWPLEVKGGSMVIVAGGLGLSPLKPALQALSVCRGEYDRIVLLFGVKTLDELFYRDDLKIWQDKGIEVVVSVDRPDGAWKGKVGLITDSIASYVTDSKNTRAFVCGPEMMMKKAAFELLKLGVLEDGIFLSMERNMKCAVGFCGHCQYGPYFLCKDGSIFSLKQLRPWLQIGEL